jgi:ComF family protein
VTPRALFDAAIDLVYPPACLSCGKPSTNLCPDCSKAFHSSTPYCPYCATTTGPYADLGKGCPRCRNRSFSFSNVYRLGSYDAALREMILQAKSHRNAALAYRLGRELGAAIRSDPRPFGADIVVPVPLHWWKRLQRGYNQAAEVADGVAAVLSLSCHRHALRRVRRTPQQPTQSAAARWDNVKGAFAPRSLHPLTGLRILLIDDVMTTGATLHECGLALKSAGAAQVAAACVAHR